MEVQLNSLYWNTSISNSSGCIKVLDKTLRSGGGLLELLGLTHIEFLINLIGTFMHDGRQLFSLTLLVDVEGSLLK
jgi:hypothetical protein